MFSSDRLVELCRLNSVYICKIESTLQDHLVLSADPGVTVTCFILGDFNGHSALLVNLA